MAIKSSFSITVKLVYSAESGRSCLLFARGFLTSLQGQHHVQMFSEGEGWCPLQGGSTSDLGQEGVRIARYPGVGPGHQRIPQLFWEVAWWCALPYFPLFLIKRMKASPDLNLMQ